MFQNSVFKILQKNQLCDIIIAKGRMNENSIEAAAFLYPKKLSGGDNVVFVWIGALIAFIVIEALTVQLLTIWFALGSLAALIATLAGAGTVIQITVFAVVSLIALVATRPFVKKFTGTKHSPTNADRCIGAKAIVTQRIDNLHETGTVTLKGTVWSARSADNSIIEEGEAVIIKEIEGVKVIVEKIPQATRLD